MKLNSWIYLALAQETVLIFEQWCFKINWFLQLLWFEGYRVSTPPANWVFLSFCLPMIPMIRYTLKLVVSRAIHWRRVGQRGLKKGNCVFIFKRAISLSGNNRGRIEWLLNQNSFKQLMDREAKEIERERLKSTRLRMFAVSFHPV